MTAITTAAARLALFAALAVAVAIGLVLLPVAFLCEAVSAHVRAARRNRRVANAAGNGPCRCRFGRLAASESRGEVRVDRRN